MPASLPRRSHRPRPAVAVRRRARLRAPPPQWHLRHRRRRTRRARPRRHDRADLAHRYDDDQQRLADTFARAGPRCSYSPLCPAAPRRRERLLRSRAAARVSARPPAPLRHRRRRQSFGQGCRSCSHRSGAARVAANFTRGSTRLSISTAPTTSSRSPSSVLTLSRNRHGHGLPWRDITVAGVRGGDLRRDPFLAGRGDWCSTPWSVMTNYAAINRSPPCPLRSGEATTLLPLQSKNLSGLPHRQSLRWHSQPFRSAPEARSTSRRQPTPSWRRASILPLIASDWSDHRS
jgi:hypothetical protein